MSNQIYIFNPEHDLCIANGDENFVPPRSAVGFAKDNTDLTGYLKRPNRQRRQIIPRGWNHALKKRLINEGVNLDTLPSEEQNSCHKCQRDRVVHIGQWHCSAEVTIVRQRKRNPFCQRKAFRERRRMVQKDSWKTRCSNSRATI